MSGRWHPTGRASVSARRPSALGVCDRCGFTYQLNRLRWQYQWQGMQLQNLRLLVCDECLDVPQIQLKTIILPPDPLPVLNPRPEPYSQEVPTYIQTMDGQAFTTVDGDFNIVGMMQVTPTPDPNDPFLGPPPYEP